MIPRVPSQVASRSTLRSRFTARMMPVIRWVAASVSGPPAGRRCHVSDIEGPMEGHFRNNGIHVSIIVYHWLNIFWDQWIILHHPNPRNQWNGYGYALDNLSWQSVNWRCFQQKNLSWQPIYEFASADWTWISTIVGVKLSPGPEILKTMNHGAVPKLQTTPTLEWYREARTHNTYSVIFVLRL